MAKVLVIYSSRGGNTKTLGEIAVEGVNEIPEVECEIKSANKVTNEDLQEADGIIAGSPVYFGTMSAELKEMFDKSVEIRGKLENKIGAAFTTGFHHSGGKETTILLYYLK